MGIGTGTEIKLDDRILFPHSLGIFYEALTRYLGFPQYGDEYKVMGLGALWQPGLSRPVAPARASEAGWTVRTRSALFPPSCCRIVIPVGRHGAVDQRPVFTGIGGIAGTVSASGGPARTTPSRYRAVGAGNIRRSLLQPDRRVAGRYRLTDIALAGGCAMNSVANGKIRRMTPFRRVYVQAAAGDAGGAIGAAYTVWHKLGGDAILHYGPCLLGTGIRRIRKSPRLIETRRADMTGCIIDTCRGRCRTLPAHREGGRGRKDRRLVSGADGVGAARARQSLDPL